MKVAIINGSPRGAESSTRVCAEFIREAFPEHDYVELPVASKIGKLTKDPDYLHSFVNEIEQSDIIIWSFPVYVLLVPAQLMQFMDLIRRQDRTNAFNKKYTTSISTSFNFYDHTAHTYMRETCEDLGMQYFPGISPTLFDVRKEDFKLTLKRFAGELFYTAGKKASLERVSAPVRDHDFVYTPRDVEGHPVTRDKKILILTDALETDTNLNNMIHVFEQAVPARVEIANLNRIDIKGGCLGCGGCLAEGVCVYKDDFLDFLREKVFRADAVVYAGAAQGRYLSALWKKYFDRQFVNGHRPYMQGKPAGYFISGPFRQLSNLQQVIEAFCQVGRTPMAGVVSDEVDSDEALTARIFSFADDIVRLLDQPWRRPDTFLGVGGHKILRDLIYSLREVMAEDHRYYEEQGFYDFPE
jgi:multimeric flavodoxin WrbA